MSSRKDDIVEVEGARQPFGRSNGGQSADRRKVDELLLGGDHLIPLVIEDACGELPPPLEIIILWIVPLELNRMDRLLGRRIQRRMSPEVSRFQIPSSLRMQFA